jgi:hypothetical protein
LDGLQFSKTSNRRKVTSLDYRKETIQTLYE